MFIIPFTLFLIIILGCIYMVCSFIFICMICFHLYLIISLTVLLLINTNEILRKLFNVTYCISIAFILPSMLSASTMNYFHIIIFFAPSSLILLISLILPSISIFIRINPLFYCLFHRRISVHKFNWKYKLGISFFSPIN